MGGDLEGDILSGNGGYDSGVGILVAVETAVEVDLRRWLRMYRWWC